MTDHEGKFDNGPSTRDEIEARVLEADDDLKTAGPLQNGTLTPVNEVAGNPDRAGMKVVLRAERSNTNWRDLWAYLDEDGNLHVDG
jgi:hypothetical protein